ncbi:MAG: tetratricopeptide repeat protein [Geminicoccaceae bacterium]
MSLSGLHLLKVASLRQNRRGSKLDNPFHVAQTLHSLANLLSKRVDRFEEAEKAYKRSIEIGETLRNENHLAQVLRNYGVAIEERSPSQAIALLERSRDINQRLGNHHFVDLVERDLSEVRHRASQKRDSNHQIDRSEG